MPLLRIIETDNVLEPIAVETVASEPDTEYVAISHVWSDGMGNPFGDALPACSLRNLRRMAVALGQCATMSDSTVDTEVMPKSTPSNLAGSSGSVEPMLIWLDTLCCPVEPPEAKELAILKMRETYRDAAHVLVLDSAFQSIASRETPMVESLIRIFTSSWTRRLWTLQEGALARRLWFQFSEGPVDFLHLFYRFRRLSLTDARYLSFVYDMLNQSQWIGPLTPELNKRRDIMKASDLGYKLHLLDMGLQHRAASMAEDERLCIATLMDLSMDELLSVEKTMPARMANLWDQIAAKYGGIPASILLLRYPKLNLEGYRWAPRTLLSEISGAQASTRLLRWTDPKLGIPTPNGLLVRFPGFRLRFSSRTGPLPRNPWCAIPRVVPEFRIIFTADSGTRYGVCIKEQHNATGTVKRHPFHLHELVDEDSTAILIFANDQNDRVKEVEIWEALIGNVHTQDDGTFKFENTIRGHAWKLHPPDVIVQDWAEKLAYTLRDDPLTKQLAHFQADHASAELKALVTGFKEKVKAAAEEALQNKELRNAILIQYGGEEALGGFWHIVKE